MKIYNEFELNEVIVYQETHITDDTTTITQSTKPFTDDEEVTHEVFFGENIKRIIKVFKI